MWSTHLLGTLHVVSVDAFGREVFSFLCSFMCSLPFLYERMFGPLPYAEDGVELFRVLESLPVLVETSDPSNVDKTVLRRAQSEQGGTLVCHESCWAY